jgi:sulfatase maturation enzyme AslB (radical SAM superfamily)
MLDGERPVGCRLCWENEDKGLSSLRENVNRGRLDTYKDRLQNTTLIETPTQMKYTAGIECNLSCRMCLPTFSSRVKKVWEILGKEANTVVDTLLNDKEYILSNRKNLQYIDITGGEPFYNKNVKSLLTDLVKSGDNQHISLHIVTNASRIDNGTVRLLKQFKDVVLSISMDGIGAHQEYIRPGSSWKTLLENIKLLKQHKISLQVVSTISVLNIIHLDKLEHWCSENQIHWANPALIDNPKELSPHNLPYQLHDQVPGKYRKYLDKPMTQDPVGFIKELDKYWRTDIVKVMPEWNKVFDSLHWQHTHQLENMHLVAKKYVG